MTLHLSCVCCAVPPSPRLILFVVVTSLLLDEEGGSGDEAVVLTDILGIEDALGTMDFKVAGNEKGTYGTLFVWYGIVWYGTVWYGMVWYRMVLLAVWYDSTVSLL